MTQNLADLIAERDLIIEEQAKLAVNKREIEYNITEYLMRNNMYDCMSVNWQRVKTTARSFD